MIDIHTHILPGIDDGAETPEQAVEILLQLKEQGITRVLLTPHFCPQSQSLDSFLESRQASYEQLLAAKGLPKDIELILSAELQLHDAIFNYENLDALKIPGTSYVLTELPAGFIANKAGVSQILKLGYNCNCNPLLAHLERYPKLFRKKDLLDDLLLNGCKLQLSLDALERISYFDKKRFKRLLAHEEIHALGTDCHNLTTRPPLYQPYLKQFERLTTPQYLDDLVNARDVFEPIL